VAHNLNPFDFVPFPAEKPLTKTTREWLKEGKLLTGWIEAQITALTPLHIVGRQEANESGRRIIRSHFYRRHGQAYIPSTSIRGMLRAFIEAACNGWASQLTPYYKKEPKKHQIGFQALDSRKELKKKNELNRIDREFQQKFALPDGFSMPQKLAKEQLSNLPVDLASFLFGYIPPEGDGFHGRISIEDAEIPLSSLSFNDDAYNVPDIDDSAFMGGGKPSAASWWYQKPYQIRLGQRSVIFVGSGYRGRKFYYHQDPQRCVEWYFDSNNWPVDNRRQLYRIPIECLSAENSTNPFRIYFEDLPEPFLHLLLFSLSPGKRLRHKLGYGKPYGYGTIDIAVTKGELRNMGYTGKTPLDANKLLAKIHAALWDREKLSNPGIGIHLHWPNVEALAKIQWYVKGSGRVFTYPPFNKNHPGFLPTIQRRDLLPVLNQQQKSLLESGKPLNISEQAAMSIARKLAQNGKRPALHFEAYKQRAEGYNIIQLRTLNIAETEAGDKL